MSGEILLVAGPDEPRARSRRSQLIRQAAARVPGAGAPRIAETSTTALAVVDVGVPLNLLETSDGAALAAVAATTAGLPQAVTSAKGGHLAGAEAGHVAVRAAADGSVVMSTDGMASVPAFWAEVDGQLLVSTHLTSLVSLGLAPDADEQGILEYLVMLHPLQDRTVLRGARLLPPGGVLTWRAGGPATITAQPLFVPDDSPMGDDEAILAFRAAWNEVIATMYERNRNVRVALGLSGGLDSRAIAAATANLGESPLTFAYGTGRQFETRVAGKVARTLGFTHTRYPVTDEFLLPAAITIAERLDGAHSPAEMFELWFADALAESADVLVNGAGGGPLWGDEKTLGVRSAAEAEAKVWSRYGGAASGARRFLSGDASAALEPTVRGGLAASFEPWDLGRRADMTVFWRVANRQVRWGNMLLNAVRRSGLRTEAPFLDSRFLRFAARLTADQRRNGRLHLRVHRELFPATAGIGRGDDGNSPRHLDHVYWSGDRSYLDQLAGLARRHPVSAGRRAARRAVEVGTHALRGSLSVHGPADWWDSRSSVFPIELWGRTRPVFAARLAALVGSARSVHPLFDAGALEAAAADLRAGRFDGSAAALARVATAAQWLADAADRARALGDVHRSRL
ncbi:asparagine synthase-related protein [Jiangella rhizosphaerae]|nr:asparagine synthetase B family protein [Jiangella rhizosphaerae]